MKTNEFIKRIETIGFSVDIRNNFLGGKYAICVYNPAGRMIGSVDMQRQFTMDIYGIVEGAGTVFNLLATYAGTPPEDRDEEEKRYIVPLPGLTTTDGEQQYLTHKGGHWFACRRNKELRQTWKEEHLYCIPARYRGCAVEWKNESQERNHKL